MIKNFLSKFFVVNELIFPVIAIFTYLALLTESYKYTGFLSKHLLIDSQYFLILALISAVLLVGRKLNTICRLIIKTSMYLVFPISTVLYLAMKVLESQYFNNYVFSTYHLQPSNFFYIVVFSFAITVVNRLISMKYPKSYFVVLVLPILFISNFVKAIDSAIGSDIFVLSHLNYSYADKLRNSWGMYYDYMEFIKENTPENSTILVPPKAYPWFLTGNIEFNRYFLYPRNLINGNEKDSKVNLDNIDFILIDFGETTISQYGFTNIWPKFDVDGDYIIYWNPKDQTTQKVVNTKYVYTPMQTEDVWGIIRVKKY